MWDKNRLKYHRKETVYTVSELANHKPENLLKKTLEVDAEKKLVRKVPTLKQVTDWVEQVGKLPSVLNN